LPEDQNTAPAETQDTPTTEAPDAPQQDTGQDTPQEASVNWEERYNNLHPEYTRATQQLSEYEQVLDLARQGDPQALGLLGLELEEEDGEDTFDFEDDPVQGLQSKVEALEARLAQEDEQTQAQQYLEAEIDFVNQRLGEVNEQAKKDTGSELSQEAIQAVGDLSRTDRFRKEDGEPDVQGAYQFLFQTLLPQQREAWVQSKKTARPGSGPAAAQNPDLDKERERVDHMAQRLQEAEQ
jgi:hypothetical protein